MTLRDSYTSVFVELTNAITHISLSHQLAAYAREISSKLRLFTRQLCKLCKSIPAGSERAQV